MSDAASSLNLHTLEQNLQNRLHAEPSLTQPMQVRCVFKEGILIALVQHGAPALPYPRKVFRVIRGFLLEENILQEHQALMYLRVEGSNQPYAFHTLTEQAKPTPEVEPEETAIAEEAEPELTESEDFDDIADFEAPPSIAYQSTTSEDSEADIETEDNLEMAAAATDEEEFDNDIYDDDEEDIGFEGFTSVEDGFDDDDDYEDEVGDRRLGKATLAFAAGLAVGFWDSYEKLVGDRQIDKVFKPGEGAAAAQENFVTWQKAVERAKNWV